MDDLEAYKAMRLESLKNCPGYFGNSYDLEAAFPETEWQHRLTDTSRACFGLYHLDELIGITAILIEDADARQAYLTQSYIRESHRKRGLSRLLYQARINWAKEQGVRKLIIGHRKSNEISRRANQRFGFIYTHCEPRDWPDGTSEPFLYYFLEL
ncbi:MAG: GNAT family N-acetyltransferase [Sphingobacteriales bacterium]|nr:MAG: GNAT family N-acetyltransferase [Sphingobacteriales bacterium]